MQLKEKLIEEIEQLDTKYIAEIYNMVLSLKDRKIVNKELPTEKSYLRVRKALRNYQGNLSDEIIAQREDRI